LYSALPSVAVLTPFSLSRVSGFNLVMGRIL
jgi:hypothetical protein